MSTRTIILTGEPQEGKSTLLAHALEKLSDMMVAGILAKGLWRNGLRHGFDLMDLASGLTTPLARRNPRATPGRVPFTFFDQGMKAGIHALDTAQCRNADLVCVDEVGKLEIPGQLALAQLPARQRRQALADFGLVHRRI